MPSLEFIALQRHDGKFHEREVDIAAAEDAFRDFPDVVESIADTPTWQRPAIAAWPALHRDIAEWSDLPDDRREATLLAVFAVATVLDDLRLLQRAACGVDALQDEFAALLKQRPADSQVGEEDSLTEKDSVIRRWKETCDAVASAARTLGADPLQPEVLPERVSDLSGQVDTLSDLCATLTEILDQAAPEELLERVDNIVSQLAEGDDSPIASWTHQIAAQWRSAYPLRADPDVESLRADVERLEAELEDALTLWRTGCQRRTALVERHRKVTRCAEQEDDPLKRLDAQDQEAKLQQQLGRAAEEIQRARDHVFQVVATGQPGVRPTP